MPPFPGSFQHQPSLASLLATPAPTPTPTPTHPAPGSLLAAPRFLGAPPAPPQGVNHSALASALQQQQQLNDADLDFDLDLVAASLAASASASTTDPSPLRARLGADPISTPLPFQAAAEAAMGNTAMDAVTAAAFSDLFGLTTAGSSAPGSLSLDEVNAAMAVAAADSSLLGGATLAASPVPSVGSLSVSFASMAAADPVSSPVASAGTWLGPLPPSGAPPSLRHLQDLPQPLGYAQPPPSSSPSPSTSPFLSSSLPTRLATLSLTPRAPGVGPHPRTGGLALNTANLAAPGGGGLASPGAAGTPVSAVGLGMAFGSLPGPGVPPQPAAGKVNLRPEGVLRKPTRGRSVGTVGRDGAAVPAAMDVEDGKGVKKSGGAAEPGKPNLVTVVVKKPIKEVLGDGGMAVDGPSDDAAPAPRKDRVPDGYVVVAKKVLPSTSTPGTTCSNCKTMKTSLWRRGQDGEPLCNACGLFFKLHGVDRPVSMKTDVIRKRNRNGGGAAAAAAEKAKGKTGETGEEAGVQRGAVAQPIPVVRRNSHHVLPQPPPPLAGMSVPQQPQAFGGQQQQQVGVPQQQPASQLSASLPAAFVFPVGGGGAPPPSRVAPLPPQPATASSASPSPAPPSSPLPAKDASSPGKPERKWVWKEFDAPSSASATPSPAPGTDGMVEDEPVGALVRKEDEEGAKRQRRRDGQQQPQQPSMSFVAVKTEPGVQRPPPPVNPPQQQQQQPKKVVSGITAGLRQQQQMMQQGGGAPPPPPPPAPQHQQVPPSQPFALASPSPSPVVTPFAVTAARGHPHHPQGMGVPTGAGPAMLGHHHVSAASLPAGFNPGMGGMVVPQPPHQQQQPPFMPMTYGGAASSAAAAQLSSSVASSLGSSLASGFNALSFGGVPPPRMVGGAFGATPVKQGFLPHTPSSPSPAAAALAPVSAPVPPPPQQVAGSAPVGGGFAFAFGAGAAAPFAFHHQPVQSVQGFGDVAASSAPGAGLFGLGVTGHFGGGGGQGGTGFEEGMVTDAEMEMLRSLGLMEGTAVGAMEM
ncbi:hypothetical protein HDU96_004944 [Phlyctochytrium bullatum]|nr:hypothetical protein HDU96_004944 [Phlyctochytrium bullatum]